MTSRELPLGWLHGAGHGSDNNGQVAGDCFVGAFSVRSAGGTTG